ncbi:hypothetical protein [Clostridium chrysemydis]|uniref:hypothetical protein n=1 Tax=Clostridium chrysemydis TaxID=2665504 RepID=UPI00188441E0|nr:hypothetical protein [Clostridium chrysemydis]
MGDFFEFEDRLKDGLITFEESNLRDLLIEAKENYSDDLVLNDYIYRFSKYLELWENNNTIYDIAFRLEYIMNHLDAATEYYIMALEDGEDRTKIIRRLIPCLYKVGNLDYGILLLRENLKENIDIKWTVANLIKFYSELEKEEELFNILKDYITKNKMNLELCFLISKMYINLRDYKRAEFFSDKLIEEKNHYKDRIEIYRLIKDKDFKKAKDIVSNKNECEYLNDRIREKEKEYILSVKEIRGSILGLILEGNIDEAVKTAKSLKDYCTDKDIKTKSRNNDYIYKVIEEINSKSTAKKILGELVLYFIYSPDNKIIIQQIAKIFEKTKKIKEAENIYRYICEKEDKKDRWEKYIIFSDRNNLYINRIYGYMALLKFGEFNNEFNKQVEFLIRKNIFKVCREEDAEEIIAKIIYRYKLYKENIENILEENEIFDLISSFIKRLTGNSKEAYKIISPYLKDIEKINCINFALYNEDIDLAKAILQEFNDKFIKENKDIINYYNSIVNKEKILIKGALTLLSNYPLAPSIKYVKEVTKGYNIEKNIDEGIECYKELVTIYKEDIPLKIEYSRLLEKNNNILESYKIKKEVANNYKNIDEFIYRNKELLLFSFYYGYEDEIKSIKEKIGIFIKINDLSKISRKKQIKLNNLLNLCDKLKSILKTLDSDLSSKFIEALRYKNINLAINVLENCNSSKDLIFNVFYLEFYTDFKVAIVKRFLNLYRDSNYVSSPLNLSLKEGNISLYKILNELYDNFKFNLIKPSLIENKLYIVTSDAGIFEDIKNILKKGFDDYSKFLIRFYSSIRNEKNVTDITRKVLKELEMDLYLRIEIFKWLDTIYEDKRFFKVLGDWCYNIKLFDEAFNYYENSDLSGEKNISRLSNKYISELITFNKVKRDEYSKISTVKAIKRIVWSENLKEYKDKIFKYYYDNNLKLELLLLNILKEKEVLTIDNKDLKELKELDEELYDYIFYKYILEK